MRLLRSEMCSSAEGRSRPHIGTCHLEAHQQTNLLQYSTVTGAIPAPHGHRAAETLMSGITQVEGSEAERKCVRNMIPEPRVGSGGTLPVPRAPVGHQGPGWQVLIGATFSPPILTNDPIPYTVAPPAKMAWARGQGRAQLGYSEGHRPNSGLRPGALSAGCRPLNMSLSGRGLYCIHGNAVPFLRPSVCPLAKFLLQYQRRMPELYVCRGRPKYRRWWYDSRH